MSDEKVSAASLRGAVDLSALVNNRAQNQTGATDASAGASGGNRLVVEGTDQNFAQLLELSRQVPVLVDLWASWAEQSTRLSATLTKIVTEYAGRIVLARIEAERNPQLAQAFQAQQVPTVAAVIGGRPVGLFVGELPEEQVRDAIEQVLAFAAQNGVTGTVDPGEASDAPEAGGEPEPAPLPPLHQEAYDAIERGDLAAAVEAYKKAIAQNPADEDAKAGLAQVSLLQRLQGKTLEGIRQAAADRPDDLDAQLDVADADLSGGHVEDAFDRLLTLFPKLDAAGRDRVRERLVELFEVVGTTDPRVIKARGRLASLLY
ncbi:tetratricopeptide repeat protein [Gryllotalpicola ginsengisoli]|uniref:tetratricopeptide repeat protein n=1 Tax=Gryllotalpicola ginsengisoli TaxID=444608 RepID=UPI0004036E15|nr:tetratricopeptide repeat protein [Gryllotalpicola ginsengisoli]